MSDSAATATPPKQRDLTVDVYFDLVCPWCMIGQRQLERAIDLVALARPEVNVRVTWRSLPLLPDVPPEGWPFQLFYLKRLGSAHAVEARRQQIREAGLSCGIRFNFERIEWMPNTQAAHLLVEHAASLGGATLQARLIEHLFEAYFLRGKHIGDLQVLAEIGEVYGMARATTLALMSSSASDAAFQRWSDDARRLGISGVPGFVFGDRVFRFGAHAPELLAGAMLESLAH